MEDNEGFKALRDAFAKFAAKHDAQDIGARVVRSLATGGKAAVDQGLTEFPKSFVNQVTKDLYALITSQEVADGLSATVRSFDETKVQEMADTLVSTLKNPDTALDIAKKLKSALDKYPAGDLTDQLDGMLDMANVPAQARMVVSVFLSQLKPVIDGMKNDTPEQIAQKITELADQIPSDLIAGHVAEMTRNVTPEAVSKQANDLVGKLPSSQAVSDVVHGVGGEISSQLARVSKITTPADVVNILQDLAANTQQIVTDTLSKDDAAKKTFDKKGGKKFEF